MKNLFVRAIAGLLYVVVSIAALIFLSAWSFHYWQAWTFLGIFAVSIVAIFGYLAVNDPQLLARRIKTSEKGKSQKVIRSLVNLAFTGAIVLSGLDHRFAWSVTSSAVVFAGDALVVLGMFIILRVFRENSFTAQTVEVEAGQKVVSSGPYARVRHPMYVGGLVFMLGIPPALGSWWGLVMILLFAPALAWRILDEEKVLGRELPGYTEYCNKVRYRLVPFVW
jgi:protein-S-isoprenylcysteine O-methyltransferase Ste14